MIDWAAALRVAAERFGIAPETFWRLSVREWRALVGERPGGALGRADLERLMRLHPDSSPFAGEGGSRSETDERSAPRQPR